MKNKRLCKMMIYLIIAFFFALIMICETLYSVSARAEDDATKTVYSDVLDDLKKNEHFNAEDWRAGTDYTMQIITVAEGEHTEFFVYVYQPSYEETKYVASSINISRESKGRLDYKNYKLKLINTNGVFQKYSVEDLYVNNDAKRYYDITSIFREYNELTDGGLEKTNDNTITEVAFEVAKLYTFETIDGYNILNIEDTETIRITDKYVGFVRYKSYGNGLMGSFDYYDSHFVAFSTNRRIDELLEADVYYTEQGYYYKKQFGITVNDGFSSEEDKYAYLTSKQTGVYDPGYWFSDTVYEWPRISTMKEFCEEVDREILFEGGIIDVKDQIKMDDESFINMAGKQWILRFTETGYEKYTPTDVHIEKYSIISNVSILRLKFKTDGIIYNLGVVDNKQSGDLNPDGENNPQLELDIEAIRDLFQEMLVVLIACILIAVIAYFLLPFFPAIGNAVLKVLSMIGKALSFILLLPFKLIGKLFNKKNK